MIFQDVLDLKHRGAKFKLVLARPISRAQSHNYFDLYIQLKTVLSANDLPTTVSLAVDAPKHYTTLERLLAQNDLDYSFLPEHEPAEQNLNNDLSTESVHKTCTICGKYDFQNFSGCVNYSNGPVAGLWSCNLKRAAL